MSNIIDTERLEQFGSEFKDALFEGGGNDSSKFLSGDGSWNKIQVPDTSNFQTKSGDTKDNTVSFTTSDVSSDSNATSWTSVSQLTSGLTLKTILERISVMMKNVRFLKRNYTPTVYGYGTHNVKATVFISGLTLYVQGTDSKPTSWASNDSIFQIPLTQHKLLTTDKLTIGYVVGNSSKNMQL